VRQQAYKCAVQAVRGTCGSLNGKGACSSARSNATKAASRVRYRAANKPWKKHNENVAYGTSHRATHARQRTIRKTTRRHETAPYIMAVRVCSTGPALSFLAMLVHRHVTAGDGVVQVFTSVVTQRWSR